MVCKRKRPCRDKFWRLIKASLPPSVLSPFSSPSQNPQFGKSHRRRLLFYIIKYKPSLQGYAGEDDLIRHSEAYRITPPINSLDLNHPRRSIGKETSERDKTGYAKRINHAAKKKSPRSFPCKHHTTYVIVLCFSVDFPMLS